MRGTGNKKAAARPRTVYQGASRPNWILTLVIALLAGVLLVGFWLFYDLQQHLIYDKDGVRLAAPDKNEGNHKAQRLHKIRPYQRAYAAATSV